MALTPVSRQRYDVPTLGTVEVTEATNDDCEAIDGLWPKLRRPTDLHQPWRWAQIAYKAEECVAIFRDGVALAIWASFRPVITLPDGCYYRLDYLEMHPELRGTETGQVVGAFLLAAISMRSTEVGAAGIVLKAFQVPGIIKYYTAAGAEQRLPRGWNCERLLVPLVFEKEPFDRLVEYADALLQR
jgi:hypothetical protein